MPNKKQRIQNKANHSKLLHSLPPTTRCPNCLRFSHGHFVPPSFGDEGYYACKEFTLLEKQ